MPRIFLHCPCAFFNWASRHESVLREWRYSCTHSFISALYGGEWSALIPGRFTPSERVPGTHWIGGWVGSRTVLDSVGNSKIPSPRRESNPRTPIVLPVAQRYTDWAIMALSLMNKNPKSEIHATCVAYVAAEYSTFSLWLSVSALDNFRLLKGLYLLKVLL
jgi:hypothetical protein